MLEWVAIPGVTIALAAVFGLLVGSFLNVVILRLPAKIMHGWREQSREMLEIAADPVADKPPGIIWESSHCPQCKHPLGALENIPLLSWLALRGRCKHCSAKISAQYPLIEALSCIASTLIVCRFGFTLVAGAGLIFTWTLIALAGIDFHTQLLPDQITLPLLWLGLLISLRPLFVEVDSSVIGAAIGYLSLWLVYWVFKLLTSKEGMGYGDFKLLAALGAWMGPMALLPIVLLSSLIGAMIGGTLLAVKGRDRATPIPFGPFLAAAGWVQFMFGTQLFSLYKSFFGFA